MTGPDDMQGSDVVREPAPGTAAPVRHGLDCEQSLDASSAFLAREAASSASALAACIQVPAFVCQGDRIIASNAPAARLVGCQLQHGAAGGFSRLFAAAHRSRIEGALHLAHGTCTDLPAATLLTEGGGACRVELRLAGIELDRRRLTLVTATAVGVPLLEPVAASASLPLDGRRLSSLTPREREVLDFVSAGATSQVIAQRLGISRRTVEAHRANLLRKLDLRAHGIRARDLRP